MSLSPKLYIDPEFSPDERATILTAAEEWHDNANIVNFTPTTDPGQENLVYVERADCGVGVGGYTYQDYYRETVCLNPDATHPWFEALCLHELGHAIRLQHVTEKHAIMNPFGDVGHITCNDVAQLSSAWGLSLPCDAGE